MKKALFSKIIWPKNSRIDLLSEVLPEDMLMKLITHFSDKSEEERIVRFPNKQTIREIIFHFYGTLVAQGTMSWDEVMIELKGKYKTLKELGFDRKEVKRLYFQRSKEILKERSNDN